ncbi:MAG: tripartite tricarboxylate transporter substrate binding protein [Betaproteobacteria bacterium]|nr:tripartite tricarboxylate transporter substrate binding protein [Betaproteobacteria bacterium]
MVYYLRTTSWRWGMKTLIGAAAALAIACADATAQAQSYPVKPVRAVVGFAVGGQIDAITRIVANKMSEGLKQQIVVENRPGAGSSIAAEIVAKAPVDGYTYYFTTNAVAVNHILSPKVSPDPIASFAPVSMIATAESVLLVNHELPVKSVKELIPYAKARAGKMNYATTSIGSPAYLGMEMLKHLTGIPAEMILYKDVNQAGVDTASGRVQLWMTLLTPSLPLIQAGKLRPIAVSGPKRLRAIPDVPTFQEIGMPTLQAASWYAILAPAGTPREFITRVSTEAARAMQFQDVRDKLATMAIEPGGTTPEETSRYLNEEMDRIRLLVKIGALKPES